MYLLDENLNLPLNISPWWLYYFIVCRFWLLYSSLCWILSFNKSIACYIVWYVYFSVINEISICRLEIKRANDVFININKILMYYFLCYNIFYWGLIFWTVVLRSSKIVQKLRSTLACLVSIYVLRYHHLQNQTQILKNKN